jgi:hypothetical protein
MLLLQQQQFLIKTEIMQEQLHPLEIKEVKPENQVNKQPKQQLQQLQLPPVAKLTLKVM